MIIREGQRWASALSPGCDYATVLNVFEHHEVTCVKHSYITADGWGGKDTLSLDEFLRAYPLFTEQGYEPEDGT